MRKKTVKGRTSEGERIARGVSVGVITAIVLLLAYSLAVHRELLDILTVDTAVIIINALSAAVCGVVSVGRMGEGRVKRAAAACGIFTLAVLAFGLATNDRGIDTSQILRITSCGAAGMICGIFLRIGKSNKKLRKRSKKPNKYNAS